MGGGDPDPDPDPVGPCRVSYTANSWNTGYTADVTVTNTGPPLNGWSLAWTWPGNQRVTNAWNATVTQPDTRVTATTLSYNASITPGTGLTFGFQGTYSGHQQPAHPVHPLNNTACTTS